ncbi:MAG TPA: hypothetical protein VGU46_09255 [Acidobacteriaceae bacterium]|nr:hypothetical protein [Acidobacteriaceae bacterium]
MRMLMVASLLVSGLMHVAKAQNQPTASRAYQLSAFGAASGVYTGLEGGKNALLTAGGDLELLPFHGVRPAIEVRGSYPVDGGNIASQRSLLGGLKLGFLAGHALRPYGDFLIGRGQMNYPAHDGVNGFLYNDLVYTLTTTTVYSPGFGVDYQFSPHVALKVDGQYQRWSLTPTPSGVIYSKVGSVGLVYYFSFDRRRGR